MKQKDYKIQIIIKLLLVNKFLNFKTYNNLKINKK